MTQPAAVHRPLRLAAAALLCGAALAAQAQNPAPTPAQLLADAPSSGAVSQLPGEEYVGPGPMTVGYLGAKKQIVLPAGRWLLLATGDRASAHAAPVPLATLVFAQLDGTQLRSLLVYVANGRPGSVRNAWAEVDECHDKGGPRGSVRVERVEGVRRGCGWTVASSRLPELHDPTWERAQAALWRLGVALPPGPLAYTRAWSSDQSADFLSLRRIDFGGRPRQAWLEAYVPLMMDGFQRRLQATELEPGQSPASVVLALPD